VGVLGFGGASTLLTFLVRDRVMPTLVQLWWSFQTFIFEQELQDIPLVGDSFMWSKPLVYN
jgi:hypothetical protein